MSKKAKKKDFPDQLFVRVEYDESDGDRYYLAFDNSTDAVDEDGPTVVATYRIETLEKLKKVVSTEPDVTI